MFKRSLRIKVMAAMFSAAFFIGGNLAEAYTYSGITSTISNLIYDNDDLIITDSANIKSSNLVSPSFVAKKLKLTNKDNAVFRDISYQWYESTDEVTFETAYNYSYKQALGQSFINDLQDNNTKVLIVDKDFNSPIEALQAMKNFAEDLSDSETKYFLTTIVICCDKFTSGISINYPYGKDGLYGDLKTQAEKYFPNLEAGITALINSKDVIGYSFDTAIKNLSNKGLSLYGPVDVDSGAFGDCLNVIYIDKPAYEEQNYEGNIYIKNNSKLFGKAGVQTSKTIGVTNTSLLSATTFIKGSCITTDGDIIAQANYSAPSGKSTITGTMITSTGTLTADKDIKATTGAISGTVINATSGNIVANNTIKATGKVKGKALNVGVINATSASITGNQSISGIFTTTGQAKLNGGAALGGKKITGLSIGTLSTSSTDAVNGNQLYTVMQSSGKTYTAGSDISISSVNAISVAKAGKVASGNTGIMTGDAVYQETSKIDSVFTANNTSITSNNSKLDNLTTSIESLRKSLGTINSSVSDAISGLPGSLANFANKDLTDLSDTGINTLKSYIKSEIKKQISSNSKTASYSMEKAVAKDTSSIDNVIASKANTFDLNALGNKLDSKVDKADVSQMEDRINSKADLSYVNDGLTKKADLSVVEAVARDAAKNTSAIAKNTDLIQSNTEAISGLKDSKADVSGSNIDVSSWSHKLGTGTLAKDDTGLVTGGSVASALDKKADIGYVAMGLGAMEGSLEQVNQSVTKDVSRVGAGASTLIGLHPTGDKFEFATAYGHYKNSNNTALGVFYKPTANSTVSVAGTIGDGDAMLSAGVSIKLGLNKEVKKVITPEEFGAMKSAVDSQDEKLDQMEKTLQQLMAR